jgi:hypothetical protein
MTAEITTLVPPGLTFAPSGDFSEAPAREEARLRYWLYANPLTGEYVSVNQTPYALAVFRCQAHGRRKETKRNPALQKCVGHEVSYEEMIEVANAHYGGRWTISG